MNFAFGKVEFGFLLLLFGGGGVTSHSSCLYIKKLQCQSPGEIAMIQATRMDSSQHLGIEAESLSSIQTSRMEEELKLAHQKGGGQ